MKQLTHNLNMPAHVLYDDGRFTVTTADIQTPHVYYPVEATTGRIRRDILWCALAYSTAVGLLLYAYSDLWRLTEMAVMAASIALALFVGRTFSILQIDARGFPARLFVARTKTIRSVFQAIAKARAQNGRAVTTPFADDTME